MFGKFMNSYYYGKSGKGDYQKDDLPRTRWQLFWEMLRVRLAGLFRLNLVTALAWLPAMYVIARLVSGVLNLAGIVSAVEMDRAAATPEEIEIYTNHLAHLNGMVFQSLLFLWPCILITGPFQAGMAYVTRNWARDEHAFVWGDFKDALLANWKQALGVSFISGLLPLVLYVGYQFYGQLAQGGMFYIVPQMLTILLGLVWALALCYFYPMMVTYKLGFMTLVKNGLLLALGRLPQTAGTRLLMLLPAMVALIVTYTMAPYAMYALMALAGYYLLLGNALARFVYASLSNAVFDRFINHKIEGVEVNRGLHREEDDDEEEAAPELPGQKLWQPEDGQG